MRACWRLVTAGADPPRRDAIRTPAGPRPRGSQLQGPGARPALGGRHQLRGDDERVSVSGRRARRVQSQDRRMVHAEPPTDRVNRKRPRHGCRTTQTPRRDPSLGPGLPGRDSSGRRNAPFQGGDDGGWQATFRSVRTRENALARAPFRGPARRARSVLGVDRGGAVERGGCAGRRGVAAGRRTVVPAGWRPAAVSPRTGVQAHVRSIPSLSGTSLISYKGCENSIFPIRKFDLARSKRRSRTIARMSSRLGSSSPSLS